MFSAASLSNSSSRSSSNSAASLLVHTFRRRNCRSLQRKPILTNPVAYLFSLTLLGQTSTSFTTGWGPSVTAHNSRLTRVAAGDGLRQQYKQVFRSLGACTMSTVAAVATPKFVVAACQIMCSEDKAENIKTAAQAVEDAAAQGAQVVVLPECWNTPYDTASFPVYAEPVPEPGGVAPHVEDSPSTTMLCKAAAAHKVYLIGGSVPEAGSDGGVYNTCVVVGPDGKILAKHRKVHLFDIDVPGGITFKESDTLSPGNTITTVATPYGKIGVGICYDIRFPEMSMAMRAAGAILLCFPGAFNMTTGPAHWELLQRARAVDNQCYVVTASPARNPGSKYQAWGHSSIVDPWGSVVATTEHGSALVSAELDVARVEEVRRSVPVSIQKRNDLYKLDLLES